MDVHGRAKVFAELSGPYTSEPVEVCRRRVKGLTTRKSRTSVFSVL
jgi:hypothetical protein